MGGGGRGKKEREQVQAPPWLELSVANAYQCCTVSELNLFLYCYFCEEI